MKRLLLPLAVPGILLLAIGLVSGQGRVAAQSGTTTLFLPIVSSGPRQVSQLSPMVGWSNSGTSYEDAVPDIARVAELWLDTDNVVLGAQVWYLGTDGLRYTSGPHGSWGGTKHTIVFSADEYIVELKGNSGIFMDSISVVTNKRTYGPYGGTGGDTPFSIVAPSDYEIAGLFGRASTRLDSTGALTRLRWPNPAPAPPATLRPILQLTPMVGWNVGGFSYKDTAPDDGRVSELWIWAYAMEDTTVNSLQFWFVRLDGTVYTPGKHGLSPNGDLHKLVFDPDEYIVRFEGRGGEFMDALSVVTNKRTYGPWGGTGGNPFTIAAPAGYEISGLYGRYGRGLDWTGGLARQWR